MKTNKHAAQVTCPALTNWVSFHQHQAHMRSGVLTLTYDLAITPHWGPGDSTIQPCCKYLTLISMSAFSVDIFKYSVVVSSMKGMCGRSGDLVHIASHMIISL